MDSQDKNKKVRHDLNNQLTVVLGYLQLLQKTSKTDSKESEWIKKILDECEKMRGEIENIQSKE